MKVMKFGGTSVGSVNSILNLKRIVENAAANENLIVVVSALGGITDKLIKTADMAVNSDEAFKEEFQQIVTRHHELIYSVIAYSDKDKCFSTDGTPLMELILGSDEIINENDCMVKISNAYFVDNDNSELRLNDHKILFSQATGINYNGIDLLIEGGDCISITSLEPQEITIYGVDGRKIRSFRTKKGTTRIAIPAGVYIVNGEKVVVR